MKKIFLFCIMWLLPFVIFSQSSRVSKYYYSDGKKQYLELNTDYFFISSEKEKPLLKSEKSFRLESGKMKEDNTFSNLKASKNNSKRYWAELPVNGKLSAEEYAALLKKMKEQDPECIVAPYFKNEAGEKLGLSNYFYVKIKPETTPSSVSEIAKVTQTEIVKVNKYMPEWYILSVTPESELNSMEAANYFYETGLFEHAYPDFIQSISPRSAHDQIQENTLDADALSGQLAIQSQSSNAAIVNDPLFSQQWGLEAIHVEEAWENGITGEGIIVAVIDGGIDLRHPDLIPNLYYKHYNINTGTEYYSTDTDYPADSHATFIAGVIGAVANNGIGVAGVAPKCQLMSLSFDWSEPGFLAEDHLVDAIYWAWNNGADVMNISWGPASNFAMIRNAIDNFVTNGRRGRGGVFVSAAGNSNRPYLDYVAALDNVLAVGAVTPSLDRVRMIGPTTWGSNYGDGLNVMAPGMNIYSTNIGGAYSQADGTSFAAPVVAGVAALLFSMDPAMEGLEVKEIIEENCYKHTYSYVENGRPIQIVYDVNKPNGLWNNQMGYGVVDCSSIFYEKRLSLSYFTDNTSCACPDEPIQVVLDYYYSRNYEYVNFDTGNDFLDFVYQNDTYENTYGVLRVKPGYNGYLSTSVLFGGGYQPHFFQSPNLWIGTPPNPNLTETVISFNTSRYELITDSSYPSDAPYLIEWNFPGGWAVTYDRNPDGTINKKACTVVKNAYFTSVPTVEVSNGCGSVENLPVTVVSNAQNSPQLEESVLPGETQLEIVFVRVYNVSGQLVYATPVTGNVFDIYSTNLQDGTYILEKIADDGTSSQQKLMLKR